MLSINPLARVAVWAISASVILLGGACTQGRPTAEKTRVYITKTGNKYHSKECSYLGKSKSPISLAEAIAGGYTPCEKCDAVLLTKKIYEKE